MSKIIGLVGEIGSGKETFALALQEIASSKKVAHIRYSDILKKTLELWGMPITRETLTIMRQTMNENFGEDSLPKATQESAKNLDADIVVLDGVRWNADVEALKSISDALLVYITAPIEARFNRIKERNEKQGESSISFEEFKEGAKTPNEILIPEIGNNADVRIENAGTLEDLREKVKDFYYNYIK